ncbi:YciI family protein [Cohaesibacter haloalkalitolerans]|uniref:YciI family protein n=1 Tax=Cohaesibacter haloalkalitolerans TaxID=1162980 RepID=UPI000E651AF3|nr:YciI family protein [Cohaesibacter haloalkalitolerans]
MHFIVTCKDKEGALEIRKANRDAHLAFARANAAILQVGGPLLSDEGEMIGSCLICEAEDKAALDAFLAQDPYAQAGLFESVTSQPWKWVLGKPE